MLSLPSSPLSFSWVCPRCTGWPPHLRSWGLTSWTSTPPPRAPSSPSPGFSTGDPASTAIVIIIFFPIIIKHNKHSAHNNTLTACLENILYIITISQESLRLFQLPWLLIHNDHYYYGDKTFRGWKEVLQQWTVWEKKLCVFWTLKHYFLVDIQNKGVLLKISRIWDLLKKIIIAPYQAHFGYLLCVVTSCPSNLKIYCIIIDKKISQYKKYRLAQLQTATAYLKLWFCNFKLNSS